MKFTRNTFILLTISICLLLSSTVFGYSKELAKVPGVQCDWQSTINDVMSTDVVNEAINNKNLFSYEIVGTVTPYYYTNAIESLAYEILPVDNTYPEECVKTRAEFIPDARYEEEFLDYVMITNNCPIEYYYEITECKFTIFDLHPDKFTLIFNGFTQDDAVLNSCTFEKSSTTDFDEMYITYNEVYTLLTKLYGESIYEYRGDIQEYDVWKVDDVFIHIDILNYTGIVGEDDTMYFWLSFTKDYSAWVEDVFNTEYQRIIEDR